MLERAVNHLRALYALRIYNDWIPRSTPTMWPYLRRQTADDRGADAPPGSLTERSSRSHPNRRWKPSKSSATRSCSKPAVGSWGRLLAKVNDQRCRRGVWSTRSPWDRSIRARFYIQVYVKKPDGYPLRCRRGETICDHLSRVAALDHQHARGGAASNCPVTPESTKSPARRQRPSVAVWSPSTLLDERARLSGQRSQYTMEFRKQHRHHRSVKHPREDRRLCHRRSGSRARPRPNRTAGCGRRQSSKQAAGGRRRRQAAGGRRQAAGQAAGGRRQAAGGKESIFAIILSIPTVI